ncbi:MAG: hypothetical protein ACFCUW_16275 [Kiloniellaceae bacterium]
MLPKVKTAATVTALAFAAAFGLAACEEQGPAEQVGETIDESVENLGESMEEAGEEVQDTMN